MMSSAVFAALLLLATYVTKRLLDEALGRLSERLADWLFPRERAVTYRFALGVVAICRKIAPNESPARRACESVRDDICDIYADGAGREHPAPLAWSLVCPTLGARLSSLPGKLLGWMFLVAVFPLLAMSSGLIVVTDRLLRSTEVSLKRFRVEYWASTWLGFTAVQAALVWASTAHVLPLIVGLAAAAYGLFGAAVVGTMMAQFPDVEPLSQQPPGGERDARVAGAGERSVG